MKKFLFSIATATLLAGSLSADVSKIDWSNTSLGADVGTTGIGITGVKQLKDYPNWAIRVGAHKYNKNFTTTDNKADYDFDLHLADVQLMADYHPWMSSFKVTVGALYNGNNLDGVITPKNSNYTFNGKVYSFGTNGKISKVDVDVDFDNTIAPFIGIGWDTSFNKADKTWGFTFNLGVAYTGKAKASYTPTYGSGATDADKKEIENNLDAEKKSLQDDLDKYKYLPYISIGFNYKF